MTAAVGRIRVLFVEQRVPVLLCVMVIAGLALIEAGHPYFFLQCDNRDYFLPAFVHNTRAMLNGEFPLYNFHQHLGTPVTLPYSALYLPNYVAVLLSDWLLGHPFATMELLALFHLPLAALGFFRLMHFFELDEAVCVFGGLGWALCGFVVTGTDSWSHIGAMAAWTPWIVLFSLRQSLCSGRRDFFILVAVRSMALFVGYPQMFACLVLFDAALVILLNISAWRSTGMILSLPGAGALLLRTVANYACVVLVTMPLLVQAVQQVTTSFERQSAYSWPDFVVNSYNMKYWLHGLVLPFTKLEYRIWPEQDFISHLGYLPLLFIIAALAMWKYHDRYAPVAILLLLAVVSLLWSADLVVTKVMFYVPVFNRFRMPFKLQFFTSFFMIAVASFGFHALLTWWRSRYGGARWLAVLVVVLHFSGMVALYALTPQRMYAKHDDPVPYDEPLRKSLVEGRIVSVGLDVIHDGQHTLWGESVPSLGFNYATLWGLQHFGGYDSLLPEKNYLATFKSNYRSDFNVAPGDTLDVQALVPLEHFRVWGVKWYVVDRKIPLANIGPLQQVYEDRFRKVFVDPNPRALAGWDDGSGSRGVQHRFRTNSMEVHTDRATEGGLLLNVLCNPNFSATIDGVPTPLVETVDAQVSIAVPAGRHEIRLTYSDRPFLFAAALSAGFLLLAGAFVMFSKSKNGVRSDKVRSCN